ncbi:MAG: hypothetical protein GX352_06440 [Clostridiales bacterium]|nr:hypothetical protein [Clostridiales bacterium]
MFDKNTIKTYRSITASDSLKRRVLSQSTTEGTRPIFGMNPLRGQRKFALAGSFLVLLLVILSLNSLQSVSLHLRDDGRPSPANFTGEKAGRSIDANMPAVVPLEIKSRRDIRVNVSSGYVVIADDDMEEDPPKLKSLSLSGSKKIDWYIENGGEAGNATIDITTGKKRISYELFYDVENHQWILKKNK